MCSRLENALREKDSENIRKSKRLEVEQIKEELNSVQAIIEELLAEQDLIVKVIRQVKESVSAVWSLLQASAALGGCVVSRKPKLNRLADRRPSEEAKRP